MALSRTSKLLQFVNYRERATPCSCPDAATHRPWTGAPERNMQSSPRALRCLVCSQGCGSRWWTRGRSSAGEASAGRHRHGQAASGARVARRSRADRWGASLCAPPCRFMAFDRHMNLVLGDSEEFRRVPAKKGQEEVRGVAAAKRGRPCTPQAQRSLLHSAQAWRRQRMPVRLRLPGAPGAAHQVR